MHVVNVSDLVTYVNRFYSSARQPGFLGRNIPMPKLNCSLCQQPVDSRRLVSPQKMENQILEIIKQERPEWPAVRGICPECHEQFRAKKFLHYLETEYRKISDMEQSLVTKVARRGRGRKLVGQEVEGQMTVGQRGGGLGRKFCRR